MGHAHGHPHAHPAHEHAHEKGARAIALAFAFNLCFTVVEAAGGWWTRSAAVLSDALHDAGDCLVLGLAWYLQRVAARGRDTHFSYGYGRFSMLGGWLSSVVLIVGALIMAGASLPRIWVPVAPDAGGMMAIAGFGLVMNGLAAWQLHGRTSMNERGAYLHLMEDVLGWAAVLAGAAVIRITGWNVVDPLLSLAISLYILWNAAGTLHRGTGILMQETPRAIDQAALQARLLALPHVTGVHDQHAWTLDGSFVVHTVHLVVGDIGVQEARTLKAHARNALAELGVHHTTIELEWAGEECGLHKH